MSWCEDGRFNADQTPDGHNIQTPADVPELADKLEQLKNGS